METPIEFSDSSAQSSFDFSALPPSYEDVINSTRYPPPIHNVENAWKLNFVDFTPHVKDPDQAKARGNFKGLIKKANQWLLLNPSMGIYKCETVTWCSATIEQVMFLSSL